MAIPAASAGFATLIALAFATAAAEEYESRYTPAASDACRTVAQAKPGEGEWIKESCPGRAGFIVLRAEDDLRQTVSVGRSVAAAENEPAAKTWFGPFNRAGDTIEWRGVKSAPPFAIIQRWFVSDSEKLDKDGNPASHGFLVVTRLPPGPVCHVAYVDVRANGEPNVLARRAAEQHARNFRCDADQVFVVGNRGRAIDIVQP